MDLEQKEAELQAYIEKWIREQGEVDGRRLVVSSSMKLEQVPALEQTSVQNYDAIWKEVLSLLPRSRDPKPRILLEYFRGKEDEGVLPEDIKKLYPKINWRVCNGIRGVGWQLNKKFRSGELGEGAKHWHFTASRQKNYLKLVTK